MRAPASKHRGVFERPKGSNVYWIRFRDESKRWHREKIGPKKLAVQIHAKRCTEVLERRFLPERFKRREVLLSEAIEDCLKRSADRDTIKDMERYGRNWKEALGTKTLRLILPGDVERYAAARRETVSEQTATHELSFLRRVYNLAIRDGLAETNPVRGLVKKPSNERLRYLTEDEESRLHVELKPDECDLVKFAIHTGLRQGEHFGLKWPCIELQADVLRVPTSKGGTPRTVPLNDTAKAILRRQPRMLRCQWVWPTSSRKGGATPGRNHLNARNFYRRVFVPALKRAGIEDFTWHDLRHTFASRLAMHGVDIRTIKELMGHKRIEMTMRYAHLAPSHLQDAVKHLDGYAEHRAKRRKRAK